MRPWKRRLLLIFSITLFALLVFALSTFTLYKSNPVWYTAPVSAADRAASAARAETKITETQNWIELVHGDAIRTKRAGQASQPLPATRVTDTHDIRFTADELNALFDKWSTINDWPSHYGRYIDNPRLIIQNDHLILAASVKDLGAVASFHFAPRLDEQGQIRLDLVKVMAGRLPLPEMAWGAQKQKLVEDLESRLPAWQAAARITPQGAANQEAMLAALSRLVIHAGRKQPSDPVLFLPVTDHSQCVPVRVRKLSLDENTLMLEVQKLTDQERADVLAKLRGQ